MRYYFIYILIFLQSICSIFPLHAESSDSLSLNYPYINYTPKDGLPSNETHCILQDSRGYIWIGTDRGLVKYDGYEFKTYTTFDGLLNNGIVALHEDDQGNIWYSTLNAMVGYISPNLKTFGVYEYQKQIDSILIANERTDTHFNELIFDVSGNIYLSNSMVGNISISIDGNVKTNLRRTSNLNIYINKIKDNYTVFRSRTSGNYIVKFNIYLNDELIHTSNIDGYLKISKPQIVYDADTLYLYDKQLSAKLSSNGEVYECIPFNNNINIYKIEESYLYNFLDKGDDGSKPGVYLSKSPKMNSPKRKILDGLYVSNVFKDINEGIWISTLKNGVYYFPSLSHLVSNKHSINGIIPINDGGIIINSKRYENYIYNILDHTTKSFGTLNVKQINFDKTYKASYSFNDYVKVFGLDRGENVNPYKEAEFCVRGIQYVNDSVYCYWVPNYLYKKNKVVVRKWMPVYNLKRVESFYYINDSLSLFGSQKGLYINSGDSFLLKDLDREFTSDPRVENLRYFGENNKIVCSILGEGIYILDEDYNVLDRITTDNGLVSNTINHLYVDQDSMIWVGTNRGINTLEIQKDTFKITNVLGASLILTSPNITQLYKEDSVLYIGTDQGVSIIDLTELSTTKVLPLTITNVQISDEFYPLSEINQLEYDQNDLEIQYLGIAYGHHGSLNYRYRLLGLSNEWIYTTERKATFLQLQSGKYTFELDVQNEYGDWIKLDTPLRFTIDKPYWETWWFRIMILGILVCIVYYYISKLKQEKQLLEDKQQLSEELNESQQKALSAQLNPHFVFNSLNSIQNFILTKRTELSSDYLSMFSKLMRFVFENSKKLYVPLSDEIEALRLYLELEQVRHNHKFRYKITSDNHLKTSEIVLPSLLIQPIIENAIWHGLLHKLEDDRLLEVNFSGNDTHLCIEVIDNGVGRGQSQSRPKFIKKQRSSGVELTKQRLHLLSQSTGLSTHFEIIDLFDEVNNPNGTSVVITIPLNL